MAEESSPRLTFKQQFVSFLIHLAVVLAVLYCGVNLVLTGSPIPLWYKEILKDPVQVTAVTETHLVSADGREVPLPFISQLPQNSPQFESALQDGVEVAENGTVTGLIWFSATCIRERYRWYRKRVNLSELAGSIYPAGINLDAVPRDVFEEFFKEGPLITPQPGYPDKINRYEFRDLKYSRWLFEAAEKQNPNNKQ